MRLFPSLLALAAAAILSPFFPNQADAQPQGSSVHGHARKYDFCLVTKDGSVSMWGSFDSADSSAMRKSAKEDTLFVMKDGVRYAITDRHTVAQAKAAVEPMQKLGRRQGELGREQGKLGSEQGKLGAKQGECGSKIGELAREMGARGRNGDSASDIEKQMKALEEQMKALGEEQQALGEEQKALGEKQKELGQQQSRAAHEAETVITKLIDEAFAKGLAHKG